MKYIIALIILGATLIIALLTSCSKYCEPQNIESGKSLQHHDTKKFRVTYSKHGNLWVVIYKNFQEERKQVVDCQPPFKNGSWIFFIPCCKN